MTAASADILFTSHKTLKPFLAARMLCSLCNQLCRHLCMTHRVVITDMASLPGGRGVTLAARTQQSAAPGSPVFSEPSQHRRVLHSEPRRPANADPALTFFNKISPGLGVYPRNNGIHYEKIIFPQNRHYYSESILATPAPNYTG